MKFRELVIRPISSPTVDARCHTPGCQARAAARLEIDGDSTWLCRRCVKRAVDDALNSTH